ncbi:unnamed protein product [Blepharisma stoltei]|uniref:EF-hand domain-containing protein n=1 Tax=Blepharisma stoltei TaxID=1481888 RepID=A0AAU9IP65_9CILI|nr:unnamed protein product [Blepharisma stoltei]
MQSDSMSDEDSDFDMDVEEGTAVGSIQVSVIEPQNIKPATKEKTPESSDEDFDEDESGSESEKNPPAKPNPPENKETAKEASKIPQPTKLPTPNPAPKQNIQLDSKKQTNHSADLKSSAHTKANSTEKSKEVVKKIEKSFSHSELDFGDIMAPKSEHKENIDVEERFYKYQEKVKEKVDKIAKDIHQEEFKECTFKPSVNADGNKRTVDEFISEMQNYEKKKQDKLNAKREENIKSQSLTEQSFQPSICEKSLQILAKKGESNEPVHEKLFKMKKTENSKQVKKILEEQEKIEKSQFKPTVNTKSKGLKRSGSIDKILYDDAVRRIHKEQEAPSPPKEKFISSKSEQVLIAKLKKEMQEAFTFLDPENEDKLNYSNTVQLLEKLFLIKNKPENNKNSEEKELVIKMWKLLGGDSGFASRKNLEIFIMGIMNYYHPEMSASIDQSSSVTSSIGRLVDGEFALLEDEVAKLHRVFYMFYENRTNQTHHSNINPTYKNRVEYTFRPQINKDSSKMADGVKLRRTESLGTNKSHEDYLISEKQKVDEKINKLKKEYEHENRKECTFKPSINKKPAYKMAEKNPKDTLSEEYKKISEDPNVHRSVALYNLSEIERKRKEKLARTAEELEIEKAQAECTFTPKLEKPILNESADLLEKKGVAETVNRMRRAREEQELIKNMKERGFTNKGELKPLNFSMESEKPKSSLSHSQSQTISKPPLPSGKFKQQRDSHKALKQEKEEKRETSMENKS